MRGKTWQLPGLKIFSGLINPKETRAETPPASTPPQAVTPPPISTVNRLAARTSTGPGSTSAAPRRTALQQMRQLAAGPLPMTAGALFGQLSSPPSSSKPPVASSRAADKLPMKSPSSHAGSSSAPILRTTTKAETLARNPGFLFKGTSVKNYHPDAKPEWHRDPVTGKEEHIPVDDIRNSKFMGHPPGYRHPDDEEDHWY